MPGLSRTLSYRLRTRPLLSRITLRYALLHAAFPSPDAAAMVTNSSHAQTPMLFVPELALAQYLRCIHIHLSLQVGDNAYPRIICLHMRRSYDPYIRLANTPQKIRDIYVIYMGYFCDIYAQPAYNSQMSMPWQPVHHIICIACMVETIDSVSFRGLP